MPEVAEVVPERAEGEWDRTADGIVTTVEEMEGYFIVKAILQETLDVSRIAYRDAKSYFNVLLDDTNRKPICRLHFDDTPKRIGLFDSPLINESKKETTHEIESLDSLYQFADAIRATALYYDQQVSVS